MVSSIFYAFCEENVIEMLNVAVQIRHGERLYGFSKTIAGKSKTAVLTKIFCFTERRECIENGRGCHFIHEIVCENYVRSRIVKLY